MPYCGHFGCGCCSKSCDKCGRMCWHSDLEAGVCAECRLEDAQQEIEELRHEMDEDEILAKAEEIRKKREAETEGSSTHPEPSQP